MSTLSVVSLGEALVRSTPLRAVVDLNEACNLRCTYCHIDALFKPHHKATRELSLDVFDRLLAEIEAMEVFEVTLTGGEVTTMDSFVDYLQRLGQLRFSASQIITNGTTLTERTIQSYLDSGVTRLSISLDSFAEENDAQRGKGTYERALRGIRTAVAHGLPVNVISVITAENYKGWYGFSRFLRDEGVNTHNLSLMCRLGRAENMLDWLGLDEAQAAWLEADFDARADALNDDNFRATLNTGALHPGQWNGGRIPIHQLQDMMAGTEAVIKINGDVHTNRLVGKNDPIGNIYDAQLSEIWAASAEKRSGVSARIISDPAANANDYYYIEAVSPERSILNSPDSQPRYGATRTRVLPGGQMLEFSWSDFTARLVPGSF